MSDSATQEKTTAMSRSPTAIALTSPADDDLIRVLQNSLYPGAKPDSIRLVLAWCRSTGRDPMKKPIHIVPMWVKDQVSGKEGYRDVLMPGIGTYRTDAASSGQYVGKSEPEFGDDVTEKLGQMTVTYPKWCKVTVYRLVAGEVRSFSAKEYWIENYASAGRGKDEPNAMWKKRAYGQLAKCSEAQALRMAFPDETGNTNTSDEMDGKVFDGVTLEGGSTEVSAEDILRRQLGTKPKESMPAVDWSAPPEDEHDDLWFKEASGRLLGEQNAWKWMALFLEALSSAPTVRDVSDILAIPVVISALQAAPPTPRAEMDAAISVAKTRLTQGTSKPAGGTQQRQADSKQNEAPPKRQDGRAAKATRDMNEKEFDEDVARRLADKKSPLPKQDEQQPTFDEVAFDESGERVTDQDGFALQFNRAVDFALWYRGAWTASHGSQALAEHNADALACARLVPEAKAILDSIEPLEAAGSQDKPSESAGPPAVQDQPKPTPLPLPRLQGGGPDWVAYNTALAKDLESVTTDAALQDWIALNEVVFRSNREPRSRSNYTARIEPMIEAKSKALQAGPARDRDKETAIGFIGDWEKAQTPAELKAIGDSPAIKRFVERMSKDRPEILKMLIGADADAAARVKAAAAATGQPGDPADDGMPSHDPQ